MQINSLKLGSYVPFIMLIMVTFLYHTNPAIGASSVSTDKDIYNYGETIKVNFSKPGNKGDWICIAPVGLPDTEGGDYKYMPEGLVQGSLTFDPPSSPGNYEVRAYYDYKHKGYIVSDRYAFSVSNGPDYEKAISLQMALMQRKIDTDNPFEVNLPSGNSLIYIFREPYVLSSHIRVQILADGKPVINMLKSHYFPYSVPSGDIKFTIGKLTTYDNQHGELKEVLSWWSREETIKAKPGYVYYLRLRVIPEGGVHLAHVPYEEGAKLIKSYNLTQINE